MYQCSRPLAECINAGHIGIYMGIDLGVAMGIDLGIAMGRDKEAQRDAEQPMAMVLA